MHDVADDAVTRLWLFQEKSTLGVTTTKVSLVMDQPMLFTNQDSLLLCKVFVGLFVVFVKQKPGHNFYPVSRFECITTADIAQSLAC